jgi:4-oxalomesaconate tautomerase
VPASAAPVVCDFLDIAGSACGEMLPTGNTRDVIDGADATCIDNGMPVVILRATDFDISGYESPEDLDKNAQLKSRLESLRRQAGQLMHLGDVSDKTIPKLCLVAAAVAGGNLATRTFIPHVCHKAIGVLGAVSVATACLLPDSVAAEFAEVPEGCEKTLKIEHPSGSLSVRLVVSAGDNATSIVERAGVMRTARLLFRGEACVRTSS